MGHIMVEKATYSTKPATVVRHKDYTTLLYIEHPSMMFRNENIDIVNILSS